MQTKTISLIGNSNVGKTHLMSKFLSTETDIFPTIGVDFGSTIIQNTKVQIWDTAGQERFFSITKLYYHQTMGFLLVFDLTDQSTFNNLEFWINNIPPEKPIVLIGNKSDRNDRVISNKQISTFLQTYHLPFYETSIYNLSSIHQPFLHLLSLLQPKPQPNPIQLKPEKFCHCFK